MPLVDGLGSTVALLDGTGAIQAEFTYEPFGKTTTSGTADVFPSQYTARDNDGTGLYYYRARYYDPATHRFMTPDPLWSAAGSQTYAYVANNPTTFTDPLGLQLDRHPPKYTSFRCLPGDPCELLKFKIKAFEAVIAAHVALDKSTGKLDKLGRPEHTQEIADFENGLKRCWDYYKKQNCDCGPNDQPMTQKQVQELQKLIAYLGTLLLMLAAATYIVVFS